MSPRSTPNWAGAAATTISIRTVLSFDPNPTLYIFALLAHVRIVVFVCSHPSPLLACYLATQDQACRKDNTNAPTDQIFYNRDCRTVDSICSDETNGMMAGMNVSFCTQLADGVAVPINQVITRILASEEYFK